jgi:putative salt-induced outer membrane protein YdiY
MVKPLGPRRVGAPPEPRGAEKIHVVYYQRAVGIVSPRACGQGAGPLLHGRTPPERISIDPVSPFLSAIRDIMVLKKAHTLPLLFLFASAPVWADPVGMPSTAVVKTDGQWRGSVNAGASVASGNNQSTSVNASANVEWATTTDKFTAALTGLYGTSTSDGDRTVSNNLASLTSEYDHDLTHEVYALGLFSIQRNELQDLNLQSSVGAGLGYHVIRSAPTTFDVFSGVSYNYEKYSEDTRNYPELLLGEQWAHKIGSSTSINERLSVYPNLGYIGDYRTQFDIGLTTAIADRIQLKLTLSNSYQNHPVAGVKKVNTLFMTSIGYAFGPK